MHSFQSGLECLRLGTLLVALLSILSPTQAQPIRIGQTAALSGGGPAATVLEMTLGAKLVLADVNARGGIRGRPIELISLDDGFDPARAAANAERLIREFGVSALFLNRGTPHTEAIVPLLARYDVPLIGPSTGAMSLHHPVIPQVFHVRSTYQQEAEQAVLLLATMGVAARIGVIHVDDSFGRDALAGARRGFERTRVLPLFVATFDRKTNNVTQAVARVKQTEALAVLIIGSTEPTAAAVKGIRALGSKAYLVSLSTNASAGFIRALGDQAEGVAVVQVFPRETAIDLPLVREAHALLQASTERHPLTPAVLEGMAAARLLVAALRKTASPITPKSLMATLNSGAKFDIGWPHRAISYSEGNHSGLSFAELSVITADGRFRR